jgi:GTPase SAR1 family protein
LPLASAPEQVQTLFQSIVDFRSVLWREAFQVTFFGTFKSGKSTLLNALLGADILPTRVLRATGTVTRIHYTPLPYASVTHLEADGTSHSEAIAFDERSQAILLNLDRDCADSSPAPTSSADHTVTLGLPLDLLRQGCMLVDTPGLMDNMALTEQSYRELARSDLAVMVLSAYQLLSYQEKEYIRSTAKLLNGNIVFVINQMDTVAAEEQADVLAQAHTVLHEVGNSLVGQPRIFATEALRVFMARLQGTAQLETTHMPDGVQELEQWLASLLHNRTAQQIALRSRLGILSRHVARASGMLQTRLDEAQRAARQTHQQTEAAQKARQTRLKRAVMEDGLRLGRLENQLDELGETLVISCVQDARRLIETDPDWPDKLPACLHRALQSYERTIYERASATLLETHLPVPLFDVYHQRIRQEIAAAEEWIGNLGFWAGLIPGLAAPLPLPQVALPRLPFQPLFDEVGAVVDGLVEQTRAEAHQQIVAAVKDSAHALLPHLHTEARHYLKQMHTLLLEVDMLSPADDEIVLLRALRDARQTEHYYRHLSDWCIECQDVIQRIQHAATGTIFWQAVT